MNRRAPNGRHDPALALAEAFAAQVDRWAGARAVDDALRATLRRVARELSLATSQGHVCLTLAELPEAADPGAAPMSLRRELLASGLVGTPAEPGAMPLILDPEGRLYLHRDCDHEQRLARRLVRALQAPALPATPATAERLEALFGAARDGGDGPVDWQKVAAALALRQRLTLISGGPGTGKTSTVVNLLACLLVEDPQARIALAAPTGKAAARMTDALRQRAAHLPSALRAQLPTEAFTVHRLLGATPERGRFVHHAGHRLALDVLVVDEASMLDLALATRLLEAVPDNARIILLGDKDQLAAVESGAVFAELSADPSLSPACRSALATLCGVAPEALVAPAPARPGPLQDAVVWFRRNYRFAADSGIGRLASDINAARGAEAIAWLGAGQDQSVRWLDDGAALPAAATLAALLDGHAPYLQAVRRDPNDLAAIHTAFAGFAVLCAVREGPRGAAAINAQLTEQARARLGAGPAPAGSDLLSPWFPGRPVMVLRNDPVLRLYNGDIGITLPDAGAAGGLSVFFQAADGGFRAVPPLRLPAHETAFATTVHKAQGSEFDAVLLLLPAARSRVLTRELLYTAVTRARQRVTLAGSAEVIGAAIEAPTRRHSGLLTRLAEALKAGVDPGAA